VAVLCAITRGAEQIITRGAEQIITRGTEQIPACEPL